MNSNLQQLIPITSAAPVMLPVMTMESEWLKCFEPRISEILGSRYLRDLDDLLDRTLRASPSAKESFEENFWWDVVDDLKSHLGAKAANTSFDHPDHQEDAMVDAETWVEDNVSSGPRKKILAAALYLHGFLETSVRLGLVGHA